MHDPSTLAFEVKVPLPWKKVPGILKNDPPRWPMWHIANIWHEDPCKGPGGDDSCGWFMRAYHGDAEVMEKIIKKFEFDWDRVHVGDEGRGKHYFLGFFYPENEGAGMPNMGVTAIAINLFFLAASAHFECDGRSNWKASKRFMRKHLLDIMLFAENPTDSLRDSIVRKWGTESKREDRIREMAIIIYGWILRATRPWYKHPRWHFRHWKLQWFFIQNFKRWAFSRCCRCNKRFPWGYSVCTNSWDSSGPLWFKSEPNVYHHDCGDIKSHGVAEVQCKQN